jgi:Dullard-like phosphatase family protein
MQTSQKMSRRNRSRECSSSNISRAQTKASENGFVADLITSSGRKTNESSSTFEHKDAEQRPLNLGTESVDGASIDIEDKKQDVTPATMFSPCLEDYFDPYFFIKTLPQLSEVVPTFRQMLLPRQTRHCPPTTLVLGLDGTLVHSTLVEPKERQDFTFTVNFDSVKEDVYVRCRPHLKEFLDEVSGLFEIIIFTAGQRIYADKLLNKLDPRRKIFHHRLFRESCVYVDGKYVKDLTILGRDLARVIMIDSSPHSFGFQVENGIPIETWFADPSDNKLLSLIPFLKSLVEADDVRTGIKNRFKLQKKIADAY